MTPSSNPARRQDHRLHHRGWLRHRPVNAEDIEATIYSALGIDWTAVRHYDPFGRGFEYVPFSDQNLYGPLDELWS